MKGKIFKCRICGERLGENPSFATLQNHSNSHHPERLQESGQEKGERQAELLKMVLQKITENESRNTDKNCAPENSSNPTSEIHRKIVASLLSSRKYTNPQELFAHQGSAGQSEGDDSVASSSISSSTSTSSQPRTVLQCRKCCARLSSFIAVKEHYESHKREEAKIAAEKALTNTGTSNSNEQNSSEMVEITPQSESTGEQVNEEFVEQETPVFEHSSSSEVAESTLTLEPEKSNEQEFFGQECAIDNTDTVETMDTSVPATEIEDSEAIRSTATIPADKNEDPETLVEPLEQEFSATAETATQHQEVEKMNTNEAESSVPESEDNFIHTEPQAPYSPAVNSSDIQPQDFSAANPIRMQTPNFNPANPVAIQHLNISHRNSAESMPQNSSPAPDIQARNFNPANLANIQPLDLSPKKSANISSRNFSSADPAVHQHVESSPAKAASIRHQKSIPTTSVEIQHFRPGNSVDTRPQTSTLTNSVDTRIQNFTPMNSTISPSKETAVQDSTATALQAAKSDVIVISDDDDDDNDDDNDNNSPGLITKLTETPFAYTESEMLAESARQAAELDKSASKETDNLDNKSDCSKNIPCSNETPDKFTFESQERSHETVDDASNGHKPKDDRPVSATTTISSRTGRNAFDTLTAFGLSSAADSSDGGKENATNFPSLFGSPTATQISESRSNVPELPFEPMAYSPAEMITAEKAKNDADMQVDEIRIVSIASLATDTTPEHQNRPHEGGMDTETTDTAPESMIRELPVPAVTPSILPSASTDAVTKQTTKGRKNKKKSNNKQQKNAQTSKKGKRGRPKKPEQRRRLTASTSSEGESDSDKHSARKKPPAINLPKINTTEKTPKETPQKSAWDDLMWNSTKDPTCSTLKLPDDLSTSELTSTVDEYSSLDEANPQTVPGKSSSNPGLAEMAKSHDGSDSELTLQDKMPKRPSKLTHRKISKESIDCSKKSESCHQRAEEVIENPTRPPMSSLPVSVKKRMTARKSIRTSLKPSKPVTFAAEQKKSLQKCKRCGKLVSSDLIDLFIHWENDCNKGK